MLEGKTFTDGALCRAGSDLTQAQYKAVKITGYVAPTDPTFGESTLVGLASTGGEAIIGILQNNPAQNDTAIIAFAGFPRAWAGAGGFTAADHLVTEAATGRLVTYAGSGTVVAQAMNTVAAGELGTVRLLSTA